jgi:hypothetical protein
MVLGHLLCCFLGPPSSAPLHCYLFFLFLFCLFCCCCCFFNGNLGGLHYLDVFKNRNPGPKQRKDSGRDRILVLLNERPSRSLTASS